MSFGNWHAEAEGAAAKGGFQSSPPALRVYSGDRLIFSSNGRWLHPLFELERFIRTQNVSVGELEIIDKIIGKAAALLIVRLGFGRAHGETMSRLAMDVFERHRLDFSYGTLIDRIDCATEALLLEIDDPEQAYQIVKERAGE